MCRVHIIFFMSCHVFYRILIIFSCCVYIMSNITASNYYNLVDKKKSELQISMFCLRFLRLNNSVHSTTQLTAVDYTSLNSFPCLLLLLSSPCLTLFQSLAANPLVTSFVLLLAFLLMVAHVKWEHKTFFGALEFSLFTRSKH